MSSFHSFIVLLHGLFELRLMNVPLVCLFQTFDEYENFEECLAFIEDYMIKHGPFDGLLGFSQVGHHSISICNFSNPAMHHPSFNYTTRMERKSGSR